MGCSKFSQQIERVFIVTIVFDNRDKAASPVGYEEYDEITVTRVVVLGGRNKYLINGHVSQQQRVQTLFHSVQLNVNNPHFLIMQGRITKVLNMKPPEILAMIEEAAGTRMYQTKKEAALATIAKKKAKVAQLNDVLTQEITPRLTKLREQSTLFRQWSASNQQVQRLERLQIAYDYYRLSTRLESSFEEQNEKLKQQERQWKAIQEQTTKPSEHDTLHLA